MGCRWLQRKLFWTSRWPKNGADVIDEDDDYGDTEEHIYEEIDDLRLENDTSLKKKYLPFARSTDVFGGNDEDLAFVLDKSKRRTKGNLYHGRFGCAGEEDFYIPMGGVGQGRGQGVVCGAQSVVPKDTQTQRLCECCEGTKSRSEVELRTSGSGLEISPKNDRTSHEHLNFSDSDSAYCMGSYIDSLYMDRNCSANGSLGHTKTNRRSGKINRQVDTEHWRTCMKELPFLQEWYGDTQGQEDSDESLYGCISVRDDKTLTVCVPDGRATLLSADRCIDCFGGCAGVWKQSHRNDSPIVVLECDSKTNPASKGAFLYPGVKEDESRITKSFKRSRNSPGPGQHPSSEGIVSDKATHPTFHNDLARCKSDFTENLNTSTKKFDVVKVIPEIVDYVNTSGSADMKTCTYGPGTLISEKQVKPCGTDKVKSEKKLHNYPATTEKGSKQFKETCQREKRFETDGRRMNNRVLMDLILFNNSQQV